MLEIRFCWRIFAEGKTNEKKVRDVERKKRKLHKGYEFADENIFRKGRGKIREK